MNQITKIHFGLTSMNFWRIVLCNFLFVLAVCIILHREAMGHPWLYLVFGASSFLPGPFCGWLLDHYKRRYVVIWAVLLFVVIQLTLNGNTITTEASQKVAEITKFNSLFSLITMIVQGACFGAFQIALGSTILIDLTASERRQPASYIYFASCFSGLICALCAGFLLLPYQGIRMVQYLPLILAILSIFLIVRLNLPFRSPQNIPIFSMDRFWLNRAWPLALNYVLCLTSACIILALHAELYSMLIVLAGSVLAYIGHGIFFREADSRAEVMVGFILLLLSAVLLLMGDEALHHKVSMAFLGYGIGAFSNRYQSLFSIVAEHCERGRAHSTFSLCQILSICLGFAIGFSFGHSSHCSLEVVVCVVFALALLLHQLILQKWCVRNSKR